MDLSELPSVSRSVRDSGLWARKKLGQHFLFDLNLTDRIVRSAGSVEGYDVLEIGPGPGALTRSLLAAGARRVIAIEYDPACVKVLQSLARVAKERLTILNQDALTVVLPEVSTPPRRIICNPPYHISIPLLLSWLREIAAYESLTLMLQKEVAAKLVASPSTPDYGRLSVMTQWFCRVRREFQVPPQAFVPRPRVSSTIVTLTPRPTLPSLPWKTMEDLAARAFRHRRKILRHALPTAVLRQAGIAETSRAQDVDSAGFLRLADAYHRIAESDLAASQPSERFDLSPVFVGDDARLVGPFT